MRDLLQSLDDEAAFQTSSRFDLLADEHVPYADLGARDVDAALRRCIEREEGVVPVVGRIGAGKSSLIAAVAKSLPERFLPLHVSVISVEVGDPAEFARHTISEVRWHPGIALTDPQIQDLERATAQRRTTSRRRERGAGIDLGFSAKIRADIKQVADDGLEHEIDPAEVMRAMRRLIDVFWKVDRCPVFLVEDTDHWGALPEKADAFFDQTARAFSKLDCVMVVAVQTDYTQLDGYRGIRELLTDEVSLPCLQDVERGLSVLLQRRIDGAQVNASIGDVLEPTALALLSKRYMSTVEGKHAGDVRHALVVMREALGVALSDTNAQIVGDGHMQEALARTPVTPSSALS